MRQELLLAAVLFVFLLGCRSGAPPETEVISGRIEKIEGTKFLVDFVTLLRVDPVAEERLVIRTPEQEKAEAEARKRRNREFERALRLELGKWGEGGYEGDGAQWMLMIRRLEFYDGEAPVYYMEVEAALADYKGRVCWRGKAIGRHDAGEGGALEAEAVLLTELAGRIVDKLPLRRFE